MGQVYGTMNLVTNGDGLALLQVRSHDLRFCPVEVPAVIDGDDFVFAGNHVEQSERAIEVALVTAEEFAIVFWILRNEDDHGAGRGLALMFRQSFYVRHSPHYGGGNLKRRTSGDVQSLPRTGFIPRGDCHDSVAPVIGRGEKIVAARHNVVESNFARAAGVLPVNSLNGF